MRTIKIELTPEEWEVWNLYSEDYNNNITRFGDVWYNYRLGIGNLKEIQSPSMKKMNTDFIKKHRKEIRVWNKHHKDDQINL